MANIAINLWIIFSRCLQLLNSKSRQTICSGNLFSPQISAICIVFKLINSNRKHDLPWQSPPLISTFCIIVKLIRSRIRQKTRPNDGRHKSVYVTRSHKRGLKSLLPMRATGQEVRDNHYGVLHLTALLQLTRSSVSFMVQTSFTISNKTALCVPSYCANISKVRTSTKDSFSWQRVTCWLFSRRQTIWWL